jgi:hypothetical protein
MLKLFLQVLDANIIHWNKRYRELEPVVESLVRQRDAIFDEHRKVQQENTMILLTATANERERREYLAKTLHIKLEAAGLRVENARNTLWWITQHLRCVYRKSSIVSVRYLDTLKRIEWIAIEYAILGRIEYNMQERVTRLRASKEEMWPVADWVAKYLALVVKQQILLDSLHESVLREEVNRLVRDERVTVEFDSLLEELLSSILADNQYIAEKVALDVALKQEIHGSQRGIELNEQLLVLKSKQKQLTSHTIDALKSGLQEKYDLEDENNMLSFGFPNDSPDLTIDKLKTIGAVMIEPYAPGHHCKVSDFLQVYLIQPWLAEQSVEDVRFEEQIAVKDLALGTLKEQLRSLKTQGKNNELRKNSNEKRIKANNVELASLYDGREGEGDSEMKERLEKISHLQQVACRQQIYCDVM